MKNTIIMDADAAAKAYTELKSMHPDLGIFGECILDIAPTDYDGHEAAILIDDSHPVAECVRSVLVRHELDKSLGIA